MTRFSGEHIEAMVMHKAKSRLSNKQLLAGVCANNAPNMQKAGRNLANGETYGCGAHTAQLVIGDVITAHFSDIVDSCRVREIPQFALPFIFDSASGSFLSQLVQEHC